jgi:hypothetical protein
MSDKVQELYEKRLAKLPRWAKIRIENLERSLAEAKAQIAGDEITNIIADPYVSPQYIANSNTIRFVVERDEWHGQSRTRSYLDIAFSRDRPNQIEITGHPGLIIFPRAGNSINVLCEYDLPNG